MKEYEVTIRVTGKFTTRVTVDSEAEAIAMANDQCSDADFGPLQDIDWEDGKITEVHHV